MKVKYIILVFIFSWFCSSCSTKTTNTIKLTEYMSTLSIPTDDGYINIQIKEDYFYVSTDIYSIIYRQPTYIKGYCIAKNQILEISINMRTNMAIFNIVGYPTQIYRIRADMITTILRP